MAINAEDSAIMFWIILHRSKYRTRDLLIPSKSRG
jgi:hypothetical protein